jgi:hypothetical protein
MERREGEEGMEAEEADVGMDSRPFENTRLRTTALAQANAVAAVAAAAATASASASEPHTPSHSSSASSSSSSVFFPSQETGPSVSVWDNQLSETLCLGAPRSPTQPITGRWLEERIQERRKIRALKLYTHEMPHGLQDLDAIIPAGTRQS